LNFGDFIFDKGGENNVASYTYLKLKSLSLQNVIYKVSFV